MKVELENYCPTTVISDLEIGETFLHRSTGTSNSDSVFMVVDAEFCYKAVDLETGEIISMEEDETVIPIKVKVVEDR